MLGGDKSGVNGQERKFGRGDVFKESEEEVKTEEIFGKEPGALTDQ